MSLFLTTYHSNHVTIDINQCVGKIFFTLLLSYLLNIIGWSISTIMRWLFMICRTQIEIDHGKGEAWCCIGNFMAAMEKGAKQKKERNEMKSERWRMDGGEEEEGGGS